VIVNGAGDLLTADVEALVNTVNCVGVMGKGLALQFKRRYPENFERYAAACARGAVQLGRMFVVELDSLTGPRYIVNFPTKGHWKARSKLEDIASGLDDLLRTIKDLGIRSIAVPPLGAGHGGLPWADVEALIRDRLGALSEIEVVLFTPANASRHLIGDRVPMTWGRAALIELIRAYVDLRRSVEPWEDTSGASHLEIQKLMYFAQLATPALRLRFEQGFYGPYSDQVRHLVQGMEGSFLLGFGDGSAPVQQLDPIRPTDEGISAADSYVSRSGSDADVRTGVVEPVMRMIEGFEGPYSIELLASTHWTAVVNECHNPHEAWNAIQKWTGRKGRLFTEHHVAAAWDHLVAVDLLSEPAGG
jgi:O-acetyl-ADP-ribose deacetylase (regulator of RNase III)